MRRAFNALVVISIFMFFAVFLRGTDIKGAVNILAHLGIYPLLVLVTTFLAYMSGAIGWKYCIDSTIKPSLIRLFIIRHTGNTITLFNPASAVVGEYFNARILIKEGVREQEAYKSVLLSRTLMILSQLTLFIFVIAWLVFFNGKRFTGESLSIVYTCFFILLILVSGLSCLLLSKGVTGRANTRFEKLNNILHQVSEIHFLLSGHIRKYPGRTLLAFAFLSGYWLFGSLELFFILYFLDYDVNLWDGLFLDTTIIILKSSASFIPGQLGIEELVNKFVLQFAGITSPDLWLSVSILRRTRLLFWSGVAVLFYIQLKRSNRFIRCKGNIVHNS